MSSVIQRLTSSPKPMVIVSALALTALLGILHQITGHDLTVAPFYLLPICWTCWMVGRRAGVFLAAFCAVVWLASDMATGYTYAHATIVYCNAFMLFTLFVFVVYLLSAFQTAHYHLEATVAQRTGALQAEITERKRAEAARLQAERLAAIGTMAAQVAHEVRNPLGSITLNLDLIRKEIEKLAEPIRHSPEEGRVLVDEMRAEVHRIQHVVDDYLQFARLPKLQRRPLELNAFLDEKLTFMHGAFEQANVKLQTVFDPTLRTVSADPDQLWEVTLNLIRNGFEAMPGGGGLMVSTQRDGAQVLVRVTDTGAGMTEDQVRQVFVPFFTTKAKGTGLGLPLAQQIVTEHGGHIECTSAVGNGSAFTICLPLAEKS